MRTKVLLITSEFNEMVTESLKKGALSVLNDSKNNIEYDAVDVPGAFEAPTVAAIGAQSGRYAAIICLGAVIRGETPHFDFVAANACRGLMDVSVQYRIPVINGILTTDTVDQALNRSGIKNGNKGREAALSCLKMLETVARLCDKTK